ncbi:septum formation protein Maf [bacterium]|nr:septum formation protein Maf [bacterium]
MGKIVLASNSPRRRKIMKEQTDYYFEVKPSPYEEKHTTTVFSYDYIENLAYNKAFAVVELLKGEDVLVVGADTVVVLGDEILGKPADKEEALTMLKKLSGKTHKVVTSIAVINCKDSHCEIQSTTSEVEFSNLDDEQIRFYIEKFKPFDKAGSYGIQELPEGYIKEFRGSLENIIGLCPKTLKNLIEKFDFS